MQRVVILSLVRLGRAVCAGGVGLAIGVAAATAPASTASCGPANGRTLASSSQARVYAGRKGVVYGCAGRRQFRLGRRQPPCYPCVGRVVVAGKIAAYVLGYPGYDSNFCEVVVRRLADGKRLATYNATRMGPFSSVPSLVARPDGHVAWIAVGGGIPEVHRDRTILDSGGTIQPHSLRLHGTLLTWRHGSKTRHARMR